MNDRETHFEQNLQRCLQASCGPESRLTPVTREQLRRELVRAVVTRGQPGPTGFPISALAVLTGFLCLLGIAWGASGARGSIHTSPFVVLMLVNLAGLPVASLVIVLRRKYV